MLVVVLGMMMLVKNGEWKMKMMSPLIDELLLPWLHGGQPPKRHDGMQRAS